MIAATTLNKFIPSPSLQRRLPVVCIGLLALYFCAKTIFFAFWGAGFVPPDEHHHLDVVQIYQSTPGLQIPNLPQYAKLGAIANEPWLYHAVVGKLMHVFSFVEAKHPLFIARAISLFFAFLYLVFFYLLAQRLLKSPWQVVVAFAIQTNLLMFTYIAAAVNYDTFSNLFSVAALYALFRAFESESLNDFLAFAIAIALGCLSKITVLPLAFLCTLSLLIYPVVYHRDPFYYFKSAWQQWPKSSSRQRQISLLLALVVIATFAANIRLWGVNIMNYKRLVPTCDQVYGHKRCMQAHSNFKRDQQLSQRKFDASRLLGVAPYAVHWSKLIVRRILGILAHRWFHPSKRHSRVVFGFFAIALLSALVPWRQRSWPLVYPMALFVAYCLILMLRVNYKTYLASGDISIAVQGRYIFPVIALGIIAFTGALCRRRPKHLEIWLAIAVVLFFMRIELPYFLANQQMTRFIR